MCARRRSGFLLLRQKKVTKEKATLHAASLRFATGNLRCSRQAGSAQTRCAQTARGPFSARRCAPQRILKGTRGGGYRTAAASQLRRVLGYARCAARPSGVAHRDGRSEVAPGPSVAMARVAVGLFGGPTPCGCAGGAQGVGWQVCRRTHLLRQLTRRGCPSAARQRVASSTAHPTTEHPRWPRSAAKGSQTAGSPFFWVLFFGEAKKSTSPAGARPGLRPLKTHHSLSIG